MNTLNPTRDWSDSRANASNSGKSPMYPLKASDLREFANCLGPYGESIVSMAEAIDKGEIIYVGPCLAALVPATLHGKAVDKDFWRNEMQTWPSDLQVYFRLLVLEELG